MNKKQLFIIVIIALICIGFPTYYILNDEPDYEWIVEPTFNYDDVVWDSGCNRVAAIVNGEFELLNSETGEITHEDHGGHGNGDRWLAYNPVTGRYGIYDSEGEQVFFKSGDLKTSFDILQRDYQGDTNAKMIPVGRFESSSPKDVLSVLDEEPDDVRADKYAYSYNGAPVTDFIYDYVDSNSLTETPAVTKDQAIANKWGFINKKGSQIVDFVFDGAVGVETGRAFVKQNGKWGIIRIGS